MIDQNFKVYLAGMTQNNKENIDELTKDIYFYFDGLIFVDHQSKDGTAELLKDRKGQGEIISIPWLNHHGLSMNTILTSNKLMPGDYIFFSDDLERISVNFARQAKEFAVNLSKHNINSLYSYGKIFGLRYFPEIHFSVATPHCHVVNPRPNAVEMSTVPGFEDPKTYRWNIRGDKRPRHSFIDHFVKYLFEYKISNQMIIGRENDEQDFLKHEQIRQNLIYYWVRVLKMENTVENLKRYILNTPLDDVLKAYFNTDRYLNDFYRFHVLKHTVDEIIADHPKKQLFFIK